MDKCAHSNGLQDIYSCDFPAPNDSIFCLLCMWRPIWNNIYLYQRSSIKHKVNEVFSFAKWNHALTFPNEAVIGRTCPAIKTKWLLIYICQCLEYAWDMGISLAKSIYQVKGMMYHHLGPLTVLTHGGRDKMSVFSQTTFSNAFSWMKILEFRLKIHWSLFLRVLSTIFQPWFW